MIRSRRPPTSTLRAEMSAIDTRTEASSQASLPIDYNKRLMLFSGRANPQLAVDIADKLGVALGPVDAEDLLQRRGLLPSYEESIRGADVFIVQSTCGNPQTGVTANDSLMGAAVHDRRGRRRLGPQGDRGDALVRLLATRTRSPRPASRSPRAWSRACSRAAGADRVLTMDLHAGQIQGFFQKPVDHMTALFMLTQYFADLGLPDLLVVAPDAGRVKLNKEFRLEGGRRAGDPRQELPRPAGRRDRLRDRRRERQDGGDRRRHDRHRRDAQGGGQDRQEEGAARVYAAATHAVFSGDAFENLRTSGLEQIVVEPTRFRSVRAARPTCACCPAPTC